MSLALSHLRTLFCTLHETLGSGGVTKEKVSAATRPISSTTITSLRWSPGLKSNISIVNVNRVRPGKKNDFDGSFYLAILYSLPPVSKSKHDTEGAISYEHVASSTSALAVHDTLRVVLLTYTFSQTSFTA